MWQKDPLCFMQVNQVSSGSELRIAWIDNNKCTRRTEWTAGSRQEYELLVGRSPAKNLRMYKMKNR